MNIDRGGRRRKNVREGFRKNKNCYQIAIACNDNIIRYICINLYQYVNEH